MAEPFLGEIHIFANAYAPEDYADCCGQLLQVSQNEALFSLLKKTYGGNGTTTFGLPDFRGRTPIGQGTNYPRGHMGGQERVAVDSDTMPQHTHTLRGSIVDADSNEPRGRSLAQATCYAGADKLTAMKGCSSTYSGYGHYNMQPSLGIRFAISLRGFFPEK